MGNLFGANEFTVDAKGCVLLMSRGDVSFTKKVTHAKNAGAVAAIIFGDQDGDKDKMAMMPIDPNVESPGIPAVYITKERGTALIEKLDKGLTKITIQIGVDLVDSLRQSMLLRCMNTSTGEMEKTFAGFLEAGAQLVPGGTLEGDDIEAVLKS